MGHLLENLLHFGRLLRRLGVDAGPSSMLLAVEALRSVQIGRRRQVQSTLRAVLVRRAEDLPAFDAAFRAFWRAPGRGKTELDLRALGEDARFGEPHVELASLGGDDAGAAEVAERVERIELRTYSGVEALRQKDFGEMTAEELAEAALLLQRLAWRPAERRSRRWRAGEGGAVDLRRLVRESLRREEPAALPRRSRKRRRRPLVLLCDVSGSMERYSRMLLQLSYSLTSGLERVEAFLFATRLTRITRDLQRRRLDLARLSTRVPDWSGGTRIGEALHAFHVEWARRALTRGPVVLLVSDGWDRGDPAQLRREMARLQRSCHRLIWLNPLLGSPEYEPLTRGMQAALPYVDDFLPAHNLASLEDLADRLNDLEGGLNRWSSKPSTHSPRTLRKSTIH